MKRLQKYLDDPNFNAEKISNATQAGKQLYSLVDAASKVYAHRKASEVVQKSERLLQ